MKQIYLNEASKELIKSLTTLQPDLIPDAWQIEGEPISSKSLIDWLSQTTSTEDKKTKFLLENLRAALLAELRKNRMSSAADEAEKKAPWYKSALFYLLASSGVLLAFSDGFTGANSIVLGIFGGASPWVLVGTGLIFSAVAIAVFCGFDLAGISENLGMELKSSRKILDIYLEELSEIKKLRQHIERNLHTVKSSTELAELKALQAMLVIRFEALGEAQAAYQASMQNKKLSFLKTSVSVLTGLLFFSYGFFSAQSIAMAVGSLLAVTVSATFPPVIILSVLGGIAAFSLYWCLQRPSIENLVGKAFGLDKEKVEAFSSPTEVAKQKDKLLKLGEKLDAREKSISDSNFRQFMDEAQRKPTQGKGPNTSKAPKTHEFFKPVYAKDDLDLLPTKPKPDAYIGMHSF